MSFNCLTERQLTYCRGMSSSNDTTQLRVATTRFQLSVVRRFVRPMVFFGLRFVGGGWCGSRMKHGDTEVFVIVRVHAGGGSSRRRGHSGSTSEYCFWSTTEADLPTLITQCLHCTDRRAAGPVSWALWCISISCTLGRVRLLGHSRRLKLRTGTLGERQRRAHAVYPVPSVDGEIYCQVIGGMVNHHRNAENLGQQQRQALRQLCDTQEGGGPEGTASVRGGEIKIDKWYG